MNAEQVAPPVNKDQTESPMGSDLATAQKLQNVQKVLDNIQSELQNYRGLSTRHQKRLENRLSDIVWFIIIFFVLDVVAQNVLKL